MAAPEEVARRPESEEARSLGGVRASIGAAHSRSERSRPWRRLRCDADRLMPAQHDVERALGAFRQAASMGRTSSTTPTLLSCASRPLSEAAVAAPQGRGAPSACRRVVRLPAVSLLASAWEGWCDGESQALDLEDEDADAEEIDPQRGHGPRPRVCPRRRGPIASGLGILRACGRTLVHWTRVYCRQQWFRPPGSFSCFWQEVVQGEIARWRNRLDGLLAHTNTFERVGLGRNSHDLQMSYETEELLQKQKSHDILDPPRRAGEP